MAELIRLVDIVKSYIMGDSIVHALDHVNVSIGDGEFTSIMGPSGSGKSTMMNILGCLDRPTSGHYFLRGRDIAGRQAGIIFCAVAILQATTTTSWHIPAMRK